MSSSISQYLKRQIQPPSSLFQQSILIKCPIIEIAICAIQLRKMNGFLQCSARSIELTLEMVRDGQVAQ
jgi:hypothetical protein